MKKKIKGFGKPVLGRLPYLFSNPKIYLILKII